MIAIHDNKIGFTPRWIAHCEALGIPYKRVNCHSNSIISDLEGCSALMWHHWQNSEKDLINAKRILNALEHKGIVVYPNFKTGWHFDDKFAQKYLLEALGLPLVNSYHFVDKEEAMKWVASTTFPKVFKLKGGAGSANVRLIHSRSQSKRYVKRAFSGGFRSFDSYGSLKERFRKFQPSFDGVQDLVKGVYRLFNPPRFAKLQSRERYEIYFQDFIPNNTFDIRVIVCRDRAFAIKRLVRKHDFRASGSGSILYEKEHFDEELIRSSFNYAAKLDVQLVAFDFVFLEGEAKIVEISYGYAIKGYDACEGYWDRNMNFHEGKFDSCLWMIEDVLKEIESRK